MVPIKKYYQKFFETLQEKCKPLHPEWMNQYYDFNHNPQLYEPFILNKEPFQYHYQWRFANLPKVKVKRIVESFGQIDGQRAANFDKLRTDIPKIKQDLSPKFKLYEFDSQSQKHHTSNSNEEEHFLWIEYPEPIQIDDTLDNNNELLDWAINTLDTLIKILKAEVPGFFNLGN